MDRLRIWLLRLFLPESRYYIVALWLGAGAALVVWIMWPLVVAPAQSGGDPEEKLRSVPGLEVAMTETAVEKRYFSQMAFTRTPLPPELPPPQELEVGVGKLFGLQKKDRTDFRDLNQQIRLMLPDCAKQISGPNPAAASDAAQKLETIERTATHERAVFHYPEGLLDLCTGNPSTALAELAKARATIDRYMVSRGNTVSDHDRQWVQQYRAVITYAEGLARLANRERADVVDATFMQALYAAKSARPFTRGAFVVLSTTQGDLFDFSTAQIVNARIYLWLSHSDAAKGLRVSQPFFGALTDVAEYPSLAANLAVAAASSNHLSVAETLYQHVRRTIDNRGLGIAWKLDRPALARVAAVAAIGVERIYSEGDGTWWPQSSQASGTRKRYIKHGGGTGELWFPQIDVGDDEEILDLWLWVRRDRQFLANRQLRAFQSDGVTIGLLAPEDRKFLDAWRAEITGVLGDRMLEKAETIRVREGLAEARPVLELLAGQGFPWNVRMQARLILDSDRSASSIVLIDFLLVLAFAAAAWVHFQLRAGYGRTFTRRHHLQRSAAGEGEEA